MECDLTIENFVSSVISSSISTNSGSELIGNKSEYLAETWPGSIQDLTITFISDTNPTITLF